MRRGMISKLAVFNIMILCVVMPLQQSYAEGYQDTIKGSYDDFTNFVQDLGKGINVENENNPLGTTNEELQDVLAKGSQVGEKTLDLGFSFHSLIEALIIASTPEGLALTIVTIIAGIISIYFIYKLAKGMGRHIAYIGITIFLVIVALLVIN